MFSFLKDKLKAAVSRFTKKVEEAPEQVAEESVGSSPQPFEPIKLPLPETSDVLRNIPVKEEVSFPKVKVEEKKVEVVESVSRQPSKKVLPDKTTPPLHSTIPVSSSQQKVSSAVKKQVIPSTVPIPPEKVVVTKEASLPVSVEEIAEEMVPEEKRGVFRRIKEALTTRAIDTSQFNELFWDIELVMLENNVAVDVIEKVKDDLRVVVTSKPLPRNRVKETVLATLRSSLNALFVEPVVDFVVLAKEHKPLVIAFIGINGSGKTTTIAKVAHSLQRQGLSVVMAAADTFRAAAIDQLQIHADKLGCKLIKHDYGADAAAVAFDAIEHAKAKKKDVVLIDTAGRLHSNTNLLDELKKIIRVAKPHLKIFVGESITGNDCTEQAREFNNAVGIDGIILSKADVDEKGGTALSISYVTKKPILFLGVGQEYDDLQVFDKERLLAQLGV